MFTVKLIKTRERNRAGHQHASSLIIWEQSLLLILFSKTKQKFLNWRKDFPSVGACVSICPKGRSYKESRVLATVSAGLVGRRFTDGSAVTLRVWWGCPHGAPNSRRASSQGAYFHSNSASAGFSFVFIGACVRYGGPYRAANGKISALSWHLSTHSVSRGPAAPQCGLQSPLRNGPQNLSKAK